MYTLHCTVCTLYSTYSRKEVYLNDFFFTRVKQYCGWYLLYHSVCFTAMCLFWKLYCKMDIHTVSFMYNVNMIQKCVHCTMRTYSLCIMNNVDMYDVDIFSVKSVKSVCNVESGHVCRMTADRILSQILPAPVTLLLHLLITILILVPEYACPPSLLQQSNKLYLDLGSNFVSSNRSSLCCQCVTSLVYNQSLLTKCNNTVW